MNRPRADSAKEETKSKHRSERLCYLTSRGNYSILQDFESGSLTSFNANQSNNLTSQME
jgi:hypothetical protein